MPPIRQRLALKRGFVLLLVDVEVGVCKVVDGLGYLIQRGGYLISRLSHLSLRSGLLLQTHSKRLQLVPRCYSESFHSSPRRECAACRSHGPASAGHSHYPSDPAIPSASPDSSDPLWGPLGSSSEI